MKLAQTIESLMIDQALNKLGFVWKLLSPHQMQVMNFQTLQLKVPNLSSGVQGPPRDHSSLYSWHSRAISMIGQSNHTECHAYKSMILYDAKKITNLQHIRTYCWSQHHILWF